MRERILHRRQVLDVPIAEAFDFFSKAANLEAIFDYRRDSIPALLASGGA